MSTSPGASSTGSRSPRGPTTTSPPRGKRASRLIRKALQQAGVNEGRLPGTGIDTIGDIAVLRLDEVGLGERRRIARAVLKEVKSVKAVYEQQGGIEGEFRLRKLRHLAGEERTDTLHRENGCAYRVDIARCYFSPRLATERLRIAGIAEEGEDVLNMFAGVGPYSILLAKRKRARVLSCELNEYACRLHEENNTINKVQGLVKVMNTDALQIPRISRRRFDRILMPHPSGANRYLGTALRMARRGATIHYYRHLLGGDEKEAAGNLEVELSGLLPPRAKYDARRVRLVGPRWVELVADIRLP